MSSDLLPENIHLRDNVILPLLNEVLRRHDHKPDAHVLDAKLFVDIMNPTQPIPSNGDDELREKIANYRFKTMRIENTPTSKYHVWVLGESGAEEVMQLIQAHKLQWQLEARIDELKRLHLNKDFWDDDKHIEVEINIVDRIAELTKLKEGNNG